MLLGEGQHHPDLLRDRLREERRRLLLLLQRLLSPDPSNTRKGGTHAIPKPGAYVVWAQAQVDSAAGGQFQLFAHGVPGRAGATPDVTSSRSILDDDAAAGATTLTLSPMLVHGFASGGGAAELECRGFLDPQSTQVRKIRIVAFRIAS